MNVFAKLVFFLTLTLAPVEAKRANQVVVQNSRDAMNLEPAPMQSDEPVPDFNTAIAEAELGAVLTGTKASLAQTEAAFKEPEKRLGVLTNAVLSQNNMERYPDCGHLGTPGTDTADVMCGDMTLKGWTCFPRKLKTDGKTVQARPVLNKKLLCESFLACHCQEDTPDAGNDAEVIREIVPRQLSEFEQRLLKVLEKGGKDKPANNPTEPSTEPKCAAKCLNILSKRVEIKHDRFRASIKSDLCPYYVEACNMECDKIKKGMFGRKSTQQQNIATCKEGCNTQSCMSDFPTYTMQPFHGFNGWVRKEGECDCWGRLAKDNRDGSRVISLIKKSFRVKSSSSLTQANISMKEISTEIEEPIAIAENEELNQT